MTFYKEFLKLKPALSRVITLKNTGLYIYNEPELKNLNIYLYYPQILKFYTFILNLFIILFHFLKNILIYFYKYIFH